MIQAAASGFAHPARMLHSMKVVGIMPRVCGGAEQVKFRSRCRGYGRLQAQHRWLRAGSGLPQGKFIRLHMKSGWMNSGLSKLQPLFVWLDSISSEPGAIWSKPDPCFSLSRSRFG